MTLDATMKLSAKEFTWNTEFAMLFIDNPVVGVTSDRRWILSVAYPSPK